MKGKMTVSHAKFQYYRHNYCLVCMTGLLGCRWHRYQQSTRDNRKRDMFWFTLFTLTFLYVTFYFYFWLIADNDYSLLEWYIFDNLKTWVPWYRIILPLTCAAFGYFFLVMVLYLCHIGHGHQIFIHTVHIVFILLTLAACIAITVVIDDLWYSQFSVVYLSLQMIGPFLHIGAVTIMTALMWFISHSWYKLSRKSYQCLWLLALLGAMVGLYIAPLYIHCPCVTSAANLPNRPKLLAHRGAEAVAPENTRIAFQKAVEYGVFGLESDVRISYDGIPFIHHDDTFQRTTNIDEVFPDRAGDDVSLFNLTDIRLLNAGSWFLEHDPFGTAGSVSDEDRQIFNSQRILTLSELLDIAAQADTVVMFDLREPDPANPFAKNASELVVDVLKRSSLNISKLYWLTGENLPDPAPGSVPVFAGAPSVSRLQNLSISHTNARYDHTSADRIREYRQHNISSIVYVVDAAWFYSYYWCVGATTITTRRVDHLADLDDPVWTLAKNSYLIMWVSVDVLSAVIIIVIFVVQRIRLFGTSFSPESISLTSARRARTYRSRTMKEKLLRDGIIDPIDDPEGQGAGVVNQPAAYSMSSLPNSSSFAGPSNVRVGPISTPDHKYDVE